MPILLLIDRGLSKKKKSKNRRRDNLEHETMEYDTISMMALWSGKKEQKMK